MTVRSRMLKFVAFEGDCWIWTGSRSEKGYGHVRYKKKIWQAHRAFYAEFVGPISKSLSVLHRCDVRACVNPEHLFLGTQQNNVTDMWAKGRGPNRSGECNWKAQITEENAFELRRIYREAKDTVEALGKRWSLTPDHAWDIARGRAWKYLERRKAA